MNIDLLISKEAPSDSEHDISYANALRDVFELYQGKSKGELLELQKQARMLYRTNGNSHHAVASCIVISELLKEK